MVGLVRRSRTISSTGRWRLAAGLTQAEVAGRLKRPQSFVSKYETGERRLDVVEFLEVAAALAADPGDLIANLLRLPG